MNSYTIRLKHGYLGNTVTFTGIKAYFKDDAIRGAGAQLIKPWDWYVLSVECYA